jgi:hypothetical protein
MKAAFLFPVLFLLTVAPSAAQVRYGITAGAGWSYAARKNIMNTRYKPLFAPQLEVTLSVPLSQHVDFQSGLGFKKKGFNATSILYNDDQMLSQSVFRSSVKYNYIQVPVLAIYKHTLAPGHHLQAGGGLYYGFLLRAINYIEIDHYYDGRLMESTSFSKQLRTGLSRSGVEAPPDKRADVLFIDCGLRLQLNYVYRDHFQAGIFHEHSFYDISAMSDGYSALKLRFTGFSLGYIF